MFEELFVAFDLWPWLLVVSRFFSSEDIVQVDVEIVEQISLDHFDGGDE
jgi:hypothetical protein